MTVLPLLAAAWLVAADPAPPPKPPMPPGTPAEQVKTLIGQYDAAMAEFRKRYEAAKSDEEQEKLWVLRPDADDYAELLVQIAEKNPKDPTAFDALVWAGRYGTTSPRKIGSPYNRAKPILARDYLTDPRIGPFCWALRYESFDPKVFGYLRTVQAKNPTKSAQAVAAFTLAKLLDERVGWVESFTRKFKPEQIKRFEDVYGKEAIADIKRSDPAALRKEYEQLLERVVTDKDYAATVIDREEAKVSLGELADRELFAFRHLQPGKPAPEIEGEDVDGVKFKLSDYRGKVVLLGFWGHW
jgi:hypothetical protein